MPRPVKRRSKAAAATQAVTVERNEIATRARDITAPLAHFMAQSRDWLLIEQGGGLGLQIYEDLRRDPHTRAVLGKRKMAVISREWLVEPASDAPADQAAADLVTDALGAIAFDRMCVGLLNAVLMGFAVAEVIWGDRTVDGVKRIVPTMVKARNARRFGFRAEDNALRLLTWQDGVNGIEVSPRKFIVLRHGDEDTEDPYGLGLGHALYWPVYFKRQGIGFWLTLADKFGSPTAAGEYPPGTPETEQRQLLAALDAMATDGSIIYPQGTVVKLLEAVRGGTINTHESLCRYMDEQISVCVLGETLTTNIGGAGSRAASETHDSVREQQADADADLLCEVLNETLVTWIVEVNMPGVGVPTLSRPRKNREDLDARAERDTRIKGLGFRPTPAYIQETYGDGWEPEDEPPPAPDPTASPHAGAADPDPDAADPADPALADAAFSETSETAADHIDHLVADALGDWRPLVDPLVDQIRTVVEEASSIEDLQARLTVLAMRAGVDPSELDRRLSRALFVARAAGRLGLPTR